MNKQDLNKHNKTVAASNNEQNEQVAYWLESAVAGDVEAFGQIYRLYADQIYRYCAYRVSSPTEAEDLTAEVFLRAWRAINRYQIGAVPFSVWLYKIAHNLVVNFYQRAKVKNEAADADLDEFLLESLSDESQSSDPFFFIVKNLKHQALRQALITLPKEHQQVLYFRFVEGWSHAEVAALLGKNEGTIRGIQYRALDALGKILDRGTFVGEQ